MLPYKIAGPHQSLRNLGKKCPLARSLTMHNFVAIRQEVSDISTVENFCSRKSGPKFTKIFQSMLLTKAPNQPKFCRNRLKYGRYPRSNICAPQKVGQN